jgi:hypothetical protein
MYHFSRSIYRELAPRLAEGGEARRSAERIELLQACEATLHRMVTDRRYFAHPAKTLFNEVRGHFALADQVQVYMVIERHTKLALDHLEQLAALGLDRTPRRCAASTRKGTPCQREPLPGREYCPSHKHLEELEAVPAPAA